MCNWPRDGWLMAMLGGDDATSYLDPLMQLAAIPVLVRIARATRSPLFFFSSYL